jgi:hypothetical protein
MKWNDAVGRRGRTTQQNDIARRHDGTTRENDGIKRRKGRIPQKNDAKERRKRTTQKNDAKERHLESANCNHDGPDKHSATFDTLQSPPTSMCPVPTCSSTYHQQRYQRRGVHRGFVRRELDDPLSGRPIKYRCIPASSPGDKTRRWW